MEQSDKEWTDVVRELSGAWQDFPTLEEIRQEKVKSRGLRLKVIEQDASAYVRKIWQGRQF